MKINLETLQADSPIIQITESAIQHIKNSICKRGQGVGIMIQVVNSGCTGKAYQIEFLDTLPSDLETSGDHVLDIDGAQVIVTQKSIIYLQGSTIDFVKEGLQSGFKFQNPNVLMECGCGKSFSA